MDLNKFFMKNKKAISPLIATVLLIAFAVALGAVVMNWGRSYVEETAQQSAVTSDTRVACAQQVNIEIVQTQGNPRVCYDEDDSQVDITIQNRGDIDIDGVTFNVLGTEGSGVNLEDESVIGRSNIERFTIDYDSSEHGDIEFVQIIPKIQISGSSVPVECSDYDLQWEEVLAC